MIDFPHGGASRIYRDFEQDGLAGSGLHSPLKSEVRALLVTVQNGLDSLAVATGDAQALNQFTGRLTAIQTELTNAQGGAASLDARLDAAAADATALANQVAGLLVAAGVAGSEAAAVVAAAIVLDESQRPGETGSRWTSDIEGPAQETAPLPDGLLTNDGDGAVARVRGEFKVASRAAYRIEPAKLYRLRVVLRRRTNPSDPAGDAIRIALALLDKDKNQIGTLVLENVEQAASAGRVERVYLFSREAGDGIKVVSADTVYARPYIQTFGVTPVTDVEVIDWLGVSVESDAGAIIAAMGAAAGRAEAAAVQSQTVADTFGARHLGPKAADPATDNAGKPLLAGAEYFNTTINATKIYNAGVWTLTVAASSGDLGNAANAALGAGLVGFNPALSYGGPNSVGRELMRIRGADVQLVGAGDSIMAGTTAPNTVSIQQALKAVHAPLTFSPLLNDGVPGSRLTTGGASAMTARYAANIYPKRPAATGASRSILLVDIGANDFAVLADADVAAWCAAFEAYCATARGDGFEIYAFTIMPRSSAGDTSIQAENRRLRMNDYIRRMRTIDGYVDAAQLFPSTADSTYFIDGTHPTDAGNRLLARALRSVLSAGGLRVPDTVLPKASMRHILPAASVDILEGAALQNTVGTTAQTLAKDIPAIGAGDFTFEAWAFHRVGDNANSTVLGRSGGTSFGTIWDGTTGYGRIYMLPGTVATWSRDCLFSDEWNHVAVTRTGGSLRYYANGLLVSSVADATNISALSEFMTAQGAVARPRFYGRALSDAEVLAGYNRLSAFNPLEAAYLFALDDGSNHAGVYVDDLSPTRAHARLFNANNQGDRTKTIIKRPAKRGVIRITTEGNTVRAGVPLNGRIVSWAAVVSVAGQGAVNLGDANGNGSFFNGALPVGKAELVLVSRFPALGEAIFVNAAGYSIAHTIVWEPL